MNELLKLRQQMEIDFLKTKTYEEINDMFNEMNGKLKAAEREAKNLRLATVGEQSKLLRAFAKFYKERYGFQITEAAIIDFETLGS